MKNKEKGRPGMAQLFKTSIEIMVACISQDAKFTFCDSQVRGSIKIGLSLLNWPFQTPFTSFCLSTNGQQKI